jgi:prepilin-type N-terminal cleavage/methylation domain-containing protein
MTQRARLLRDGQGFTLIELMIVTVIIGILVSIAMPTYNNMTNRARVAQVKSTMHIVQVTVEDFASRNNGTYPQNAAVTTNDGALTLLALFPGASLPDNPFTAAATTLDWSNALGTVPATDPAGGVALNVVQSAVGGAYDTYEIIGADHVNVPLSLVLSNS